MPITLMALPRFEHKFRISETTAGVVRDYISAFLDPDAHVADATSCAYPVNSLYFDSDDLRTVRSAVSGARRRFKLRVRTYDEKSDSPVFFEIKHRIAGQIVKERGAVHRASYEEIILGRQATLDDMYFAGANQIGVIDRFRELMNQIDARPKAHVRYLRQAWAAGDNSTTRVTMDRDVRVSPRHTTRFLANDMSEPTRPFGDIVILEVKFSGKPPAWFNELQRITGLRRTSAAKYCDGVLARGENEFSSNYVTPADPVEYFKLENRRQKLAWLDPREVFTSLRHAAA